MSNLYRTLLECRRNILCRRPIRKIAGKLICCTAQLYRSIRFYSARKSCGKASLFAAVFRFRLSRIVWHSSIRLISIRTAFFWLCIRCTSRNRIFFIPSLLICKLSFRLRIPGIRLCSNWLLCICAAYGQCDRIDRICVILRGTGYPNRIHPGMQPIPAFYRRDNRTCRTRNRLDADTRYIRFYRRRIFCYIR